jgi:lipopolysaccharide/colanic/teichoic acid biosynthesis glycosyltransferase
MFGTARNATPRVFAGLPSGLLTENIFVNALRLERKRSERSGNCFLLALLHLDATDGTARPELLRLLPSIICPVLRDTDLVGCYEGDTIVGIIFTHLQDRSRTGAKDAISSKLSRALSASPEAKKFECLRITYHFFPENDSPSPEANPLVEIDKDSNHARARARVLKRTIDIVASLFFLLLFSPLFLVIAILVKVDSKGPVFFKQKRLGQYAKAFTFLKFRSMYANNDPGIHREYVTNLIAGNDVAHSDVTNERVFKIVDDPRITVIGRILRKTSLDELPQFLNVLKGDMSLVGPRPPVPYEFEQYAIWHRRRIVEVKPGISGLWQVSARSKATFDEMVRLDLQYARTWSLWLDLKILLQTPAAVISGNGAY